MRKKLVGDARKRQGRGFALIGSALFLFPADLAIIGSIRIFICISKKGKRVASDRAARCDGCSQRPSGCRSLLDQKIKGKTLTNHKVCRSFLLLFCLVKTKGAIEPAHVLFTQQGKKKDTSPTALLQPPLTFLSARPDSEVAFVSFRISVPKN